MSGPPPDDVPDGRVTGGADRPGHGAPTPTERGGVARRSARDRPRRHQDHHHGHVAATGDSDAVEVDPVVAQWTWIVVIAGAVLTLLAVIVLWPGQRDGGDDPLVLDTEAFAAEVRSSEVVACSYDPDTECRVVTVDVSEGPDEGRQSEIELPIESGVRAGDDILVTVFETEGGELVVDFYDYRRGGALLLLVALFAGAVIALGRWRGLGALAGLAVSFGVIVWFTLPAVLDGSNAVVVAVVSASAIAYLALFLAHGPTTATAVALVSTLASLVLTALLAWAFVGLTNLTGLTDDPSLLLASLGSGVDARGILLAGVVIGSLGVLDDVTVTQVSAVWQLRAIRPELGTRELLLPALRIGRDHISSTVNTLFLAYAGTALPLLLLFTEAAQSFSSTITREIVAVEVVRTLVGSIGLVAAVPISTGLAALAAQRPYFDGSA